ncbi:MAG TPA: RidA family protein [Streptosporangiaceae bacterium]|jgi:enamine deaminase RidA (YjgF/YER057c/UK114 family)
MSAERETQSAHRLVNPLELAPAVGFSHAVVAAPGRTVYLGGQTAQRRDGTIGGETLSEQFDLALANLVTAVRAVGGEPEHLVSMIVYTTDAAGYRAGLRELGQIYRRHLGKHYPAMAFFEVSGLFDPAALVELVCTAVIPG